MLSSRPIGQSRCDARHGQKLEELSRTPVPNRPVARSGTKAPVRLTDCLTAPNQKKPDLLASGRTVAGRLVDATGGEAVVCYASTSPRDCQVQ
jgi:hypothetical protein